jgi:phage baseplate assembly protein W
MPSSFRQQDVTTPHFKLPFQFGGIHGGAYLNEQDSTEDIVDCIKVIIAFPTGSRQDLPSFGTPDLLFKQIGTKVPEQLAAAIRTWEDRAEVNAEGGPSALDDMILDIMVRAGIRG